MRRISIITLLLIIGFAFSAKAQNASCSASQRIELQLHPIIEFSSVINFNVNQPQLRIRSNSNFIVNAEKEIFGKSGRQVISNGKQSLVVNGSRGSDKVFALNNTGSKSKNNANGNAEVVIYTATEP